MRLAGKRVLVLGATGGIGKAIAIAAAREGGTVGVHFCSRKLDGSAIAADILGIPLKFDLRDASAVARGIEDFVEQVGGIDMVVNAAGVHRAELLVQASDSAIREQLDVNLAGAIYATRAALAFMFLARAGTIVHIGSDVAHYPARGGSVYAATKGAIESLVKAIAVEYGRKNIRAFCIAPGPVDTKMLDAARALSESEVKARSPEGRIAAPEELAALCMDILAESKPFSNGSVVPFNALAEGAGNA
jgi:3-oxoacyl-[acyl-carrier protein] reductase